MRTQVCYQETPLLSDATPQKCTSVSVLPVDARFLTYKPDLQGFYVSKSHCQLNVINLTYTKVPPRLIRRLFKTEASRITHPDSLVHLHLFSDEFLFFVLRWCRKDADDDDGGRKLKIHNINKILSLIYTNEHGKELLRARWEVNTGGWGVENKADKHLIEYSRCDEWSGAKWKD